MNGVAVRSLENSRGPFAIVRRTFLVSNNSNILVIKCENTTSENRSWVSRKLQISSTNRTLCPWSEYTLNRLRGDLLFNSNGAFHWCLDDFTLCILGSHSGFVLRPVPTFEGNVELAGVWVHLTTEYSRIKIFLCVCIVCSKTPRLRTWILTTCEDNICQLSLLYI